MQTQIARCFRRAPGMVLASLVVLFVVGSGQADDPVRVAAGKNSSALVPADASFYSALLRNKEQIDLFYKSNAYKALRDLPLVKKAYEQLKSELGKDNGPMQQIQALLEAKENQELLTLLLEMGSDEIFAYGGKTWGELLVLAGKVSNAQNLSQFRALLNGTDPTKAQARGVLLALQADRKQLRVPELVFGFKISNAARAEAQIKRLEELATALVENFPPLKGKLSRAKVGSGNLLTLKLDGSLIPWDDINLKDYEEKNDEFQPLLDHARKMTLTVSLGVKDGYLLLGITPESSSLEAFGSGKALSSVEEMAVVQKFANRPLTGIGYTSKAFLQSAVNINTDYTELAGLAKEALERADIKDARKEAIKKDIDRLFAEASKTNPQLGAQVAFSFLTPTGYEGYSYNFSKQPELAVVDCKLLNHLGGDPILGAAFGFTSDGKGYATTVDWIKTIYGHAEGVLLDMAPEEGRDQYKQITGAIFPLLKRLDETTTKLLIPSMKQSGLGLVLDAKWKSKQWSNMVPTTPREMPMAELGLLLGISDAAKFTEAMKEYRTILNELYEKTRESVPQGDNIPAFKIPAPETEKGKNGTLIYYPFPEELGLDKQVQLITGVAKDVSVVAFSKQHGERLMAGTALKNPGVLAGKGKLVGGFVLNWVALIDAVQPWLEFTVANAPIPPKEKAQFGDLNQQLKTILTVFRAFKGASSATYVEDGKVVTHSAVTVKDIAR